LIYDVEFLSDEGGEASSTYITLIESKRRGRYGF